MTRSGDALVRLIAMMQLDMEQGFHTLCRYKVTIAVKSRGDAWLISSGISSLFVTGPWSFTDVRRVLVLEFSLDNQN